ncbi:MAG: hypothetical protein ACYC09_10950, partial [Bacteroidota bacterium]
MNENETHNKNRMKVYYTIGGTVVLLLVGLLSYETVMFEYNRVNGNTDYFKNYLEKRSSFGPDTAAAYSRKTKVREAVLILLENPSSPTYKPNLTYLISSFYSLLDKGHYIYANEYSIAFRERYVIFEDKERILQYYFAGDSKVAEIVFPLVKYYSKTEVGNAIGKSFSDKIESTPKIQGSKRFSNNLFGADPIYETNRGEIKMALNQLSKMPSYSNDETLRNTLKSFN